jgi:adenylate kinase
MNIIIFGPPGSGKGTYSFILSSKLNIPKISTGDIFREIAKEKTELGKRVCEFLNRGQLVPDYIVNEIVKERLEKSNCKNGFILDGYPRTIAQARFLEKIAKIDVVINIFVHEEILVERICARRICEKCGNIYNVADTRKTVNGIDYVLPPLLPKKDGVCDKCNGKLYHREDDNPEVIRARLRVYEEQSKPLIDYYKNKVPFVNVISNRPPEDIAEKILIELKNLKLL